MYIDLGPENLEPANRHSQQREPETSQSDRCYDSDGDDESSSEEEDEFEDIDEVIRDREPPQKPDANYDSSIGGSVEAPFTPSMPCPSITEPSFQTHIHCDET